MPDQQDDENLQAKLEALRHLRDKGFYEPSTDNPEGLDLDQPARTPNQAANALNTPPLNANVPQGIPSPTPTPALNPGQNPENTMQMDPTNLINALKRKAQQKQLEDLLKAARQ